MISMVTTSATPQHQHAGQRRADSEQQQSQQQRQQKQQQQSNNSSSKQQQQQQQQSRGCSLEEPDSSLFGQKSRSLSDLLGRTDSHPFHYPISYDHQPEIATFSVE